MSYYNSSQGKEERWCMAATYAFFFVSFIYQECITAALTRE
jgi:hypothetical protein